MPSCAAQIPGLWSEVLPNSARFSDSAGLERGLNDNARSVGRPLKNLRLSVTTAAIAVQYCMPRPVVWLPAAGPHCSSRRYQSLHVFATRGCRTSRSFTGASRSSRRDLPELIRMIARKRRFAIRPDDHGVMLAEHARYTAPCRSASVNGQPRHPARRSLSGPYAVRLPAPGPGRHRRGVNYFEGIKLDSVMMRGTNETNSFTARVRKAHRRRDFGYRIHGRRRRDPLVARSRDVATGKLTMLGSEYGPIAAVAKTRRACGSLPPVGRTLVGIISSTTDRSATAGQKR